MDSSSPMKQDSVEKRKKSFTSNSTSSSFSSILSWVFGKGTKKKNPKNPSKRLSTTAENIKRLSTTAETIKIDVPTPMVTPNVLPKRASVFDTPTSTEVRRKSSQKPFARDPSFTSSSQKPFIRDSSFSSSSQKPFVRDSSFTGTSLPHNGSFRSVLNDPMSTQNTSFRRFSDASTPNAASARTSIRRESSVLNQFHRDSTASVKENRKSSVFTKSEEKRIREAASPGERFNSDGELVSAAQEVHRKSSTFFSFRAASTASPKVDKPQSLLNLMYPEKLSLDGGVGDGFAVDNPSASPDLFGVFVYESGQADEEEED